MRSKTSATLLLMATFALGGITGAILRYLYHTRITEAEVSGADRGPDTRNFVDQLAKDLKLDDSQKEKLRSIFAESREKYHKLEQSIGPQFRAIREETNQSIRSMLTEEQKERFEKLISEAGRRHRPRGNRPPQ